MRKAKSKRLGPVARVCWCWALGVACSVGSDSRIQAESPPAPVSEQVAQGLFQTHCLACHAEGQAAGKFALDTLLAQPIGPENRSQWWSVLKNVRSELMPPSSEAPLPALDRQRLIKWLQTQALELDPRAADPGQVTLRRLNRIEYRNTIRDLMGIEFDSQVEFPPDDTGHGFDTVGDAMSVSPLLMEKYLQAAEQIVLQAVPQQPRVPAVIDIGTASLLDAQGKALPRQTSFYEPILVTAAFEITHAAEYELELGWEVRSGFDYDPARCEIEFLLDGQAVVTRQLAWGERNQSREQIVRQLSSGQHTLQFQLRPLVDKQLKQNDVRIELTRLQVVGPTDRQLWVAPTGYDRFFDRPEPPTDPVERWEYARHVLAGFASRAFRRPVDALALEQLLEIAKRTEQSGHGYSFEQTLARAMVAVLASPRFLFRIEAPLPDDASRFPQIDEYALASRLSYFLWSTMPDQRLLHLAAAGKLREELPGEIRRMMADERFRNLTESFVGQWLQTRDVETISIDPLEAIGAKAEYDELRDRLREKFGNDRSQWERRDHSADTQALVDRYRQLRATRDAFGGDLRRDMRRETEETFHYVASQDRSLLELLDGRYCFVNRRLAQHYSLNGAGAEGLDERELRRIDLPPDSPRGGILGQGSFLLVTSNPTRTSPVKRGLFILDNLLGTPAAPPPAAVPELEAAASAFADRKPTLRELLELHRQDALCASCHQRFDPLGLALENFNALGGWRETDAGTPINAAGELITGEAFADVRQLKKILAGERRSDFYRCFTSKLMTYALGRGVEYHDELVLNKIVDELERDAGRFSTAVLGIVRSAAFDRMRRDDEAL